MNRDENLLGPESRRKRQEEWIAANGQPIRDDVWKIVCWRCRETEGPIFPTVRGYRCLPCRGKDLAIACGLVERTQ